MIPNIRTPFHTAFLPSLPLGHDMMAFTNDLHLSALASPDYYKYLISIPRTIGTLIFHCYADCRMFIRSFISMVGTATQRDIDRRINKIFQFRNVLETDGDDRQAMSNRFSRFSSEIRNLFFYVNDKYLQEFRVETDPAKIETIRREILRECDRAICLQRTLTAVNVFIRVYSGKSLSHTYTSQGQTGGGTTNAVPHPTSSPTTVGGIDVNVPLSVAYDKDAIPVSIQQKANEIARLKGIYDGLPNPTPPPDTFNDPIMYDIMAFPVFDASHHVVQGNLAALRAVGAIATTHNANRALRHSMDKDSLEGHIAAGSSWAPSKCPVCRHPEHGGIRRQFLRIDTGLQDDILQFLIANIPAHLRGPARL